MNFKNYLGLVRLLLLVLLVPWGMNQATAQTKSAQHQKPTVQSQATARPSFAPQRQAGTVRIGGQTFVTGQRTITDAAGRVHVRSDRVTYAQRKAAAQRRVQAMRQAAAQKRQGEVKR